MIYIKLQLCCLAISLYMGFMYFRMSGLFKQDTKNNFFVKVFIMALITLVLDLITSYTVNHTAIIPTVLNKILHGAFYISTILVVYVTSFYMLKSCGPMPRRASFVVAINIPFILGAVAVLFSLPYTRFIQGETSNYTSGPAVYASFIAILLYVFILAIIVISHWQYLESHKRVGILTFLIVASFTSIFQYAFPESLITSVGMTFMIIAVYLNLDDPVVTELAKHDNTAITGFADLIENRDSNTGGHIKRTSIYVRLIVDELRRRGMYYDILTNDFLMNLIKAAPMHDVGKITIPDSILQKPGRLTAEEFDIMKTHCVAGGNIVKQSFANLGTNEFRRMAYELALCHHEKWNGKGYPYGLAGTDIPLGARILAIADVFDALSEKRCYRDAMPLDECFRIIEEGSGVDFEPLLVECFLCDRAKIISVHDEFKVNAV